MKWEYKAMSISESDFITFKFIKYLNDFGKEGWESVGFSKQDLSYVFLFKRLVA